MKDSEELARLCSADIGREVTPEEVRRALLPGSSWEAVFARFTALEREEIAATLMKELAP